MEIKVYYDGLQMDCCGEPFAIGDTVEWPCVQSIKGNWIIEEDDYTYEAHADSDYEICGEVTDIEAVDYEFIQMENGVHKPVSYALKPIQRCERFVAEGYLITLKNVSITPE